MSMPSDGPTGSHPDSFVVNDDPRLSTLGRARVLRPAVPVLTAGLRHALLLSVDGEIERLSLRQALARAEAEACMVCHSVALARRLGAERRFRVFDLLELFAFVRPARFCAPTPRGLAEALGLPLPQSFEAALAVLPQAAGALLTELAAADRKRERDAAAIAWRMGQFDRGQFDHQDMGWPWARYVLHALGEEPGPLPPRGAGLRVWQRLPEWQELPPEPPPGDEPVSEAATRRRLSELLGEGAEARPQQADYASAVAQAFAPRPAPDEPNAVLAEAGTGVGKTLGYIAPASLWAEANDGTVWLSTYTRNLQSQIDEELERLFPNPAEKARKVVVRKGRENYLCLLNFEEALAGLPLKPDGATALGLMARWAAATRDGDMVGGDFPGWLADLLGRARTLNLTDQRGECIYSACPHYKTCFVEQSIRRARRAEIVVANHALVMIQAALGGGDDGRLPTRLVFDEGHHLFEAADSAFSARLSGREGRDLRRWLLGAEGGRNRAAGAGRARGIAKRLEGLEDDPSTASALDDIAVAARALPGEGWLQRVAEDQAQKSVGGPVEAFLRALRQQVYARARRPGDSYSLESTVFPVDEPVLKAAEALDEALDRLLRPLEALRNRLARRLEEQAEELDSDQRRRIEASLRGLERRGVLQVKAWRSMLAALPAAASPEDFVDWFAVERLDGRDLDIGFARHWVDPMQAFAQQVAKPAHGIVVTSATLTDGSGDTEADWQAAELRSGASHLARPALRARVPSPFDYASHTRVLVVNDVRKDDLQQVAGAYRALFLASGGGGLGLFTAIQRLRRVHAGIGPALEAAGLPLYAQHVDGLDVSTLVDIFRAEEDACLLGTDAVRDGVDVPGRALRLIVFDRVPWPRPDLRHKARRELFGKRRYDDLLTRLRLKQAFGRLVRRADDRGVFVLLDPMMPSRLAGAFPEGVEIQRLGLKDAVAETRDFLKPEE